MPFPTATPPPPPPTVVETIEPDQQRHHPHSPQLTLSAIHPVQKTTLTGDAAAPFSLRSFYATHPHSQLPHHPHAHETTPAPPVVLVDSPTVTSRTTRCRPLGHGLDGFVVDNLLTPAECEYLSNLAHLSYSFWDQREGLLPRKDYRNADTVELIQPTLAAELWERLHPFVPQSLQISADDTTMRGALDLEGIWEPYNTTEHVLFARYTNGGHFAPHTDGFSIIDFNTRSQYSIIIYLNNCTDGGQTRFYAKKQNLVLDSRGRYTGDPADVLTETPCKQGSAVVFYHNHVHEGVALGLGQSKIIIRSDIMYRRREPILTTEPDKEAFRLYQAACDATGEEAARMFRKAFKMSPALARIYRC